MTMATMAYLTTTAHDHLTILIRCDHGKRNRSKAYTRTSYIAKAWNIARFDSSLTILCMPLYEYDGNNHACMHSSIAARNTKIHTSTRAMAYKQILWPLLIRVLYVLTATDFNNAKSPCWWWWWWLWLSLLSLCFWPGKILLAPSTARRYAHYPP